MKMRLSFVSNSSSSSFLCITKPKTVKNLLKEEDPITKKIVNEYLNEKQAIKIKLGGQEYLMWNFTINTDDFGCDCGLEDEEWDDPLERWYKFIKKLEKEEDVVISDTM